MANPQTMFLGQFLTLWKSAATEVRLKVKAEAPETDLKLVP